MNQMAHGGFLTGSKVLQGASRSRLPPAFLSTFSCSKGNLICEPSSNSHFYADRIYCSILWAPNIYFEIANFECPLTCIELPWSSNSKKCAYDAGDQGLIPGLGRSSREGNGNPLQYSFLENSMTEKPGGLYSSWGCKELDAAERLTHKHASKKAKAQM